MALRRIQCLIIVLLLLVACGKQATQEPGSPQGPQKQSEVQQTQVLDEEPGGVPVEKGLEKPAVLNRSGERIKGILLSPESIFARDRLSVQAQLMPVLKDEERLSYVFWVNGKEFSEQDGNSIPPFSYAKGDTLFVDVLLLKDEEIIERNRSDLLVVKNSMPEIGEIEFPEIRGPGTYKIKVQALDPDNDQLSFYLTGNPGVPLGMDIDEHTGEITYKITDPPGSSVKFKVVVQDKDGGEDWRELVINFTTPER